jgi:hypothetical protein
MTALSQEQQASKQVSRKQVLFDLMCLLIYQSLESLAVRMEGLHFASHTQPKRADVLFGPREGYGRSATICISDEMSFFHGSRADKLTLHVSCKP